MTLTVPEKGRQSCPCFVNDGSRSCTAADPADTEHHTWGSTGNLQAKPASVVLCTLLFKLLFRVCSLIYVSKISIMIIIIAFKGAIRDLLQSPHSDANCLQHVRSSGPGTTVCKSRATHRALIMCKCHVTCHLV